MLLTAYPAPVRLYVAGQPLSARRRVVTLVAMCVAQGMILLDNTIVNVALPSIQRELDVDPGNLIWVVNAYVLASLIMVGGTLGIGTAASACFLLGWRSSPRCLPPAPLPDESVLIAARAAQGVGAALVAPSACRSWLTPTHRSVALLPSESGLLQPGWGSVPGRLSAASWSSCSPGRPCSG